MSKVKELKDKDRQAEIIIKGEKRFIRTPHGTELPLLQLRGKDYLQVAHRLVWLREEHPDWQIITEPLEINVDKKYAIFRSLIKDDDGKTMATATKAESIAGFSDYVEKAETGATGRAVALCGFGTQFAPEFDEETRLADSPVEVPKKSAGVVNAEAFKSEDKKFSTVIQREQSTEVDEACKNCGSHHLTIGLTKPDNPRNPNRPYWKCVDCPPERSFSHWVKDPELNEEAVKKVAARQQKNEETSQQISFE